MGELLQKLTRNFIEKLLCIYFRLEYRTIRFCQRYLLFISRIKSFVGNKTKSGSIKYQ